MLKSIVSQFCWNIIFFIFLFLVLRVFFFEPGSPSLLLEIYTRSGCAIVIVHPCPKEKQKTYTKAYSVAYTVTSPKPKVNKQVSEASIRLFEKREEDQEGGDCQVWPSKWTGSPKCTLQLSMVFLTHLTLSI